MLQLLEFIIEELKNPFPEFRRQFGELDLSFLFFKMTVQPKFQFQTGAIIPTKINKLTSKNMYLKLDCGSEILVESYDIVDKERDDISKEYFEGQVVLARIKSIKFESLRVDFTSILKLDLSLKPSVLNDHVNYVNKLHTLIDKYNIVGNLK